MYGLRYLRPLRNLLRIFSAERTPHQIALAVALGVVIGLLPKGNLVAGCVTVALFALRVNLGVGLTTAFLVSLAGDSIDTLTHGVGVRILQRPTIYASLSQLYELPLVPWTSLNNTVVVGGTLLGALLCYPIYHLARSAIEALLPLWRRLRRRQPDHAMRAEWE